MFIPILLIIAGMALLIKGGDFLVDGASGLARRLKISELAIGLTIVAFGTSAPELVVSVAAAIGGHPEISLGNVIGSNNFNLLVVLGIAALVTPPLVQIKTIRIEIPFSLFAALLLLFLANINFLPDEKYMLTRIDSIILLMFFGLFLFYVYKSMKTAEGSEETVSAKTLSLFKSILFIVLGLAFLIVGGRVVVDASVDLARILNISEKIIGLTIVAAGTSLPELVTSVTAMVKKNDDIAIGNIIGSNIFNIFLILGVSSMITPINYAPIFNMDTYFLIFSTLLLLLFMFVASKRKLDRWQGAIFLLLYIGYVVYLIMRNE